MWVLFMTYLSAGVQEKTRKKTVGWHDFGRIGGQSTAREGEKELESGCFLGYGKCVGPLFGTYHCLKLYFFGGASE